ncbi:hypothetical protein [Kitasatospora sp. NPDC059571]|uniref:hypothetical protein n=1 Tax=Kitasatospora sp. NPDC059571 TaxID=3346871 RepID=UPI0036759A62
MPGDRAQYTDAVVTAPAVSVPLLLADVDLRHETPEFVAAKCDRSGGAGFRPSAGEGAEGEVSAAALADREGEPQAQNAVDGVLLPVAQVLGAKADGGDGPGAARIRSRHRRAARTGPRQSAVQSVAAGRA